MKSVSKTSVIKNKKQKQLGDVFSFSFSCAMFNCSEDKSLENRNVFMGQILSYMLRGQTNFRKQKTVRPSEGSISNITIPSEGAMPQQGKHINQEGF